MPTSQGVDKLHAQGITGKGIKIGILDTGVDYMHPSLGGGIGPGFKVAGGYDFAGDAYNPGFVDPQPDDDPRDTCVGHGTHVAGIVGATPGNEFNISGVAYDASLYAYRVMGCAGFVGDDVLIEAILRAYNEGMDIITMSLGGASGWSDEAIAVVASRIAKLGPVVTVAAGNDGAVGPFYFSAPATGKDVLAVGSIDKYVARSATSRTTSSSQNAAQYCHDVPDLLPPTELLFRYSWLELPESITAACQPLGDDVPDLSGYVVVFKEAPNPTEWTGEIQCDGTTKMGFSCVGATACFTLYKMLTSVQLINQFNNGVNVTVTFRAHGSAEDVANPSTGGLVSRFSSFGPTNELFFKPALSAPGGNITSTYLNDAGGWAVASGTSMATPYMAGSVALLLQTKGKAAAQNAQTIFETTAIGVPESRDPKARPHTLAQQGAGLINVYNALNVRSEVTPGELLLNDTAHWKGVHKLQIKNTAKLRQTYDLEHKPAGTIITMPRNYMTYPKPSINAPVTVLLSQTRLTLAPGATATVFATVVPPKNLDPRTLPLVSGWIEIQGSLGDRLQVSYMGVAGSLHDAQTISKGITVYAPDVDLPALQTDTGPQKGPRNYTTDVYQLPQFIFLMAQNSGRIVVDLIDAKTQVRQSKRSIWWWWWPGIPGKGSKGSFDDVPILDRVVEWVHGTRLPGGILPEYWVVFPVAYGNGTALPYGEYRLLLRALKPFGNPNLQKDYDVYLSEQVNLVESL
ncbi:subtilisin-like protein [Auricularia subglabra TFB-10046 SS5]|uniref:Subtilisin-like protein n=1 Tax=Auricularia subglabra (strain TFB-10046 / SS5) TaxID=717982 RepID=J0WYH8_AURST|nr:subtilisin-like protein [Auricularia subglabra TFB-10046 SS5]